ncbi:biotin-dependent carboxyltransferase family protein [Pseudomonas oryzihabitans]|uniref:Allophanate hydrolase n=1 Tax=Pseudomonas oryzihabitans TaxID=47885 RepID=A0A2Z5A4X6_9PSED|nr:biotin-dependent carboxyltransferase family protein [Pseudomonas oryzihabitans]AXA65855.1 allophanate hydrolase [Pseudomonas oryzihabitans]
MSGLKVIKSGPLTLLQDLGRQGWQHLGVAPSGPMDGHAARWANRLVGNPMTAPLLEIALGGAEFESETDTWLALTGAPLDARLDGEPLPAWSCFPVQAGARLRLGFAQAGQRAYLAAAGGGFQAPATLDSVASNRREGLGGLEGRGAPLAAGQRLTCTAVSALHSHGCGPAARFVPDYREVPTLRVILGGDAEAFGPAQQQTLFTQPWRISPQSDRMGIRLAGDVPLAPPRRQWSLGVVTGAIQVPPDGQPIVLMADRQTMGGYPLLGFIHPLDLARLAQCPAHHEVRFAPVELAVAQAEWRRFLAFFGG